LNVTATPGFSKYLGLLVEITRLRVSRKEPKYAVIGSGKSGLETLVRMQVYCQTADGLL